MCLLLLSWLVVQALFSVLKTSSSDEMQQAVFGLIQRAKIEDLTYRLDVSEKQSQHALEEVTRLTGAGCNAMPQEAATNKDVATTARAMLPTETCSREGPRQGSVGSITVEEQADNSLQSKQHPSI